jgi:hypothetical protein
VTETTTSKICTDSNDDDRLEQTQTTSSLLTQKPAWRDDGDEPGRGLPSKTWPLAFIRMQLSGPIHGLKHCQLLNPIRIRLGFWLRKLQKGYTAIYTK